MYSSPLFLAVFFLFDQGLFRFLLLDCLLTAALCDGVHQLQLLLQRALQLIHLLQHKLCLDLGNAFPNSGPLLGSIEAVYNNLYKSFLLSLNLDSLYELGSK